MDRRARTRFDREVYGVGQAAGLLGLRSDRVRSWLDGYTRGGKVYPPVVREVPTSSDLVTWGEFVELGYLREYRHAGVSLQSLRPVIAALREHYDTPYPLGVAKPYVSDRELVMRLQQQHGVDRSVWMVLASGQGILDLADGAANFHRKIEFDPNYLAHRLAFAGKASPVRIDPEVAFGMPAVRSVSTERLFELWSVSDQSDRDISRLAEAYELPADDVRAAISYEEQQRTLAA